MSWVGDASGQIVSRRVVNERSTKSVVIPEGITGLEHAFNECINLETVSLPSTLKTIGKRTFTDCSNLSSITLPEGLTSIDDCAFMGCSNLSSITLPEGLISIGDSAFRGCDSIDKLVIPDSVTDIGESAFFLGGNEYMNIYGNPNSYIKTYADTHDVKFSCIVHRNIITDLAIVPICEESGKIEGSHCSDCGMVLSRTRDYPINRKAYMD